MDSYQENQFEDGFDQIEDKQWSGQEEEQLNGSPADEGIVEKPASTIKICNFCGKTFNNGKALGGHRRHHLQALRKEKVAAAAQSHKVKIRLPKHKNYENSSSVNGVGEDNIVKMESLMLNGGKTTCDLCNKDFPSRKSYYGHMRTHPESERGTVLRPGDDSKQLKEDVCITSSTVIAPHESPVDLKKSLLPSWAKTDLRGRKSIGAVEAAQNLVHFSRKAYFSASSSLVFSLSPNMLPQAVSTSNTVEAKSSTSGVAMQCKEKKVDDSPSGEQKERKKKFHRRGSLSGRKDEVEVEVEEEDANWGEEECEKNMKDDDSHLDESKMMVMKEKKRKKTLKLMSPQSSESEEKPLIKTLKARDGYKCSICGKTFAAFQALGGHRSSHNKGKSIVRTVDGSGDHNNGAAGLIPQVNETKGSEFRGVVAEALAADTAQALGDHQSRRSCSRRSSAETPPSEEASSAGTSLSHAIHQEVRRASPSGPRVFNIDLNELYVMDEQSN